MSDALAMRNATNSPPDKTDDARARILKLVPGEGLVLYNAGYYSVIEPADYLLQFIWFGICLAITAVARWKYMEDPTGTTRQWIGISISCAVFVVYVYASGGPFKAIPQLWYPAAGNLAVLLLPVIAGLFYDGPKIDKPADSPR